MPSPSPRTNGPNNRHLRDKMIEDVVNAQSSETLPGSESWSHRRGIPEQSAIAGLDELPIWIPPDDDDTSSIFSKGPTTSQASIQALCDHILDQTIVVTIGQFLKHSPTLRSTLARHFTDDRESELAQSPTNPTTTSISAAIAVDRQMPVVQITIEKTLVDNVLLDGGSGVNLMSNNLRKQLGLPQPKPSPYFLKMADQTRVQPVGLFNHLKITVHNIPYIIVVTVVEMADQQADYSMILGRPWLRDAKVEHDWGRNQITLGGPQAPIMS